MSTKGVFRKEWEDMTDEERKEVFAAIVGIIIGLFAAILIVGPLATAKLVSDWGLGFLLGFIIFGLTFGITCAMANRYWIHNKR
jgi:uncharacterized protein YacL